MKKTILLAVLAVTACVDPQADAERAFARYKGQPIDAVTSVWGPPIHEGPGKSGTVYTFSGNSPSTSVSTSTTTGFIGNTPVTATTTSSTPITIHCRIQVFTNANQKVIGWEGDGAKGACSDMFRRL